MMTSVLLGKVVVRLLIARDNTEGWDRNSSSSKSAPTLKEIKMMLKHSMHLHLKLEGNYRQIIT